VSWQQELADESQALPEEGTFENPITYWIEHPDQFYGALEAYQSVLLARSFDVGSELVHPPRKLMSRFQEDAIDAIRWHRPHLATFEQEFHSAEDGGDGELARLKQKEIERILDGGLLLLSGSDARVPPASLRS
jgi:hypothetical protein